jgi:paraquat-inducible protein A
LTIEACPDCDLLQRVPELPPRDRAVCARCGHVLKIGVTDSFDRPLALSITALVVLLVANLTPMMGISAVGRHASTTVVGGCVDMWLAGERITAVIVAFCSFVAPGAFIALLCTVLVMVRRPPAPTWVGEVLRWAHSMKPWAMIEVMMLGVLVALVKIAELATVQAGTGMYAIFVLMILFPAIAASLDVEQLWQRIRWADGELPHVPRGPVQAIE